MRVRARADGVRTRGVRSFSNPTATTRQLQQRKRLNPRGGGCCLGVSAASCGWRGECTVPKTPAIGDAPHGRTSAVITSIFHTSNATFFSYTQMCTLEHKKHEREYHTNTYNQSNTVGFGELAMMHCTKKRERSKTEP